MDLLAVRYADPSFLLDGYIQTGRLCQFIREVMKLKADSDRWEYYLHKVFDKSFEDFCEDLDVTEMNMNQTTQSMEATVNRSMDILKGFTPDEG